MGKSMADSGHYLGWMELHSYVFLPDSEPCRTPEQGLFPVSRMYLVSFTYARLARSEKRTGARRGLSSRVPG